METRKVLTIWFLALGLLVWPVAVSQAEPMGTAFAYQGRLMDANYPADGFYDFQFKLFDDPCDPCDANQLGSDVNKPDVDVIDGYFTVELDFNDVNSFNGDAQWLEVGVRPGEENDPCEYTRLAPRQEVTPTPYALYAQSSGGLDSSGDVVLTSGSGEVEIGTPNEPADVNVAGSIRADDAIKCGNTIGFWPPEYILSDTGKIIMGKEVSGAFDPNIKVGIGTPTPGAELEVNGQVKITGGSPGAGKVLTSDADGLASWQTSVGGGDSDWTISGSDMYTGAGITGNVGIGTSSPAAKLTVNGAILRSGSAMYGTNAYTHINLGTSSTTGTWGQNYSWATVGGGRSNTASGDYYATVAGGGYNNATEFGTTVGGGLYNTASGIRATVGGGEDNGASGDYATIGGGQDNIASGNRATVGGGDRNTASGIRSVVGGGYDNKATDYNATVGGGNGNEASVTYATVGGGIHNTASNTYATVGGGKDNIANGYNATVGGGQSNKASGTYATIPGGDNNKAGGYYSFAAGHRAKANHWGTFVWGDSIDADFASTANDQFLIRASGGVGIGTNDPNGALDVNGAIYQRGITLHADYVFETDYQLESIAEHAEFMYTNKHLKAIPKGKLDENGMEIVEVGSHRKGIVEELEKAHIYIEQLHKRISELQRRNDQIQARLATMDAAISKLIKSNEGGQL